MDPPIVVWFGFNCREAEFNRIASQNIKDVQAIMYGNERTPIYLVGVEIATCHRAVGHIYPGVTKITSEKIAKAKIALRTIVGKHICSLYTIDEIV